MSIRVAGELVTLAERQHRARFLRLLTREEKFLLNVAYSRTVGMLKTSDVEAAFYRIRCALKRKRH